MQIRRDLIESFLEHILDFSDSKFNYQNFSANLGDKSENSGIFGLISGFRAQKLARTENPEISQLELQKNIVIPLFFQKKLLQIRRDLIESFLEHILDLSDSNFSS